MRLPNLSRVPEQKSSESWLDFLLRASGHESLTLEDRAILDPVALAKDIGPKPWPWRVIGRLAQLEPTSIHWRTWLMLSGRGFGKMLDVNTLIPVPSGWARLGDMQAGDELFDERGNVCRVTATFDGMPETAYRLSFSDGTTLDACGEHQWVTWTHAERKAYLRSPYEKHNRFPSDWPAWRLKRCMGGAKIGPTIHEDSPGPKIRTTQEIVATLTHGKRLDTNHCIPVAGPLTLPDADLPLDPYVLGVWLGDGSKSDATHGLHRVLRNMGLLHNKHVPARYLRASTMQRLALLQGLMDTDGCSTPNNNVEFCNTNPKLAFAVMELARSLGQKPMLYGVDKGPKWRVTWSSTVEVFRMSRKQRLSPASQQLRNCHRMIVAAQPIEPRPMRCLTVDSPNSMYLAGDGMIPTHNTRAGAQWAHECAERYPLGYIVGPTANDVRAAIIEGESGILATAPPGKLPEWKSQEGKLTWPNGHVAYTYSAETPDRLRNKQGYWAWCLVGETLVTMADYSLKTLRDVNRGDYVQTRNGAMLVTASVMTKRNASICRLLLMDGRSISGTEDHPVWVEGRGFIPLGYLREGERVCVIDAPNTTADVGISDHQDITRALLSTQIIASVERLETTADVYDLSIDGEHEFFANGILVHNCDETAAWQYLQDTWDNLQFGLRLGPWPRALVTTTPRGIEFLRRLVANSRGEEIGSDGIAKPIETVVTGGSTFENAKNLSPSALKAWRDRYEGTRLGRQELEAAILDDAENALWTHERLDALRVHTVPCRLLRVAVAVDPSAGSKKTNDEQGIGVVGLGEDRHLYVLADRTCKLSPDGWAETAVRAAIDYGADCIVGEINCGGEMVGALIRGAMTRMNVTFRYVLANAKMGKGLRAEPVSAMYEQGRAHHVGTFAKLEDEMCLLSPFGYQGTNSPNRIDAVVWAATELLPGVYETKTVPKLVGVRAIQIDDDDKKDELTPSQVAQLPDVPLAADRVQR